MLFLSVKWEEMFLWWLNSETLALEECTYGVIFMITPYVTICNIRIQQNVTYFIWTYMSAVVCIESMTGWYVRMYVGIHWTGPQKHSTLRRKAKVTAEICFIKHTHTWCFPWESCFGNFSGQHPTSQTADKHAKIKITSLHSTKRMQHEWWY